MKKILKKILASWGYSITNIRKFNPNTDILSGHEQEFMELYARCKPFTMTSIETMFGLYKSVEYIIRNNIPGDFAECGVWKGGSSMLVALMLLKAGRKDSRIILYDTFEGMPEPGQFDSDFNDQPARREWEESLTGPRQSAWCLASPEEVKNNMLQTGYPPGNIILYKGMIEETPGTNLPGKLALLRLDTDWYDSTLWELKNLYPLLTEKGVIIIDDYGHWRGCRKAADEYFSSAGSPVLLNRIDYSTRIGIKM